MPQHLQTVHLRHDHIQQHSAQGVLLRQNGPESLPPVLRLFNGVVCGEEVGENLPVDLIVVHNQEGVARFAVQIAGGFQRNRRLSLGVVAWDVPPG